MPKWADYVITAVRYSTDPKHIESVQARADNGESLGSPGTRTRTQVIGDIGAGTTFVTAYQKDEKWTKGEDVRVVIVDGTKYIRTDANSKAADNLGSLPTF